MDQKAFHTNSRPNLRPLKHPRPNWLPPLEILKGRLTIDIVMKPAPHAAIQDQVAKLDELLALLGEADPDAAEETPRFPLLEEHVRAARNHLLAAEKWDYEDSLKQATREVKKVEDHDLHKKALSLLNDLTAAHKKAEEKH